MTSAASFKYKAFLSYRNADARQAAWLHQTLEKYVVPRALAGTVRDRGVVIPIRTTDRVVHAECGGSESWVAREIELFRARRPGAPIHAVIGNAGDWVINNIGSYERVYMGATYRYNPEDATAFRLLPVTDADYLVREITTRCVTTSREHVAGSWEERRE